jgi:hypothetical protein
MSTSHRESAFCRLIADINMPDHERAWAPQALVRAEAIATFIVAAARLPGVILKTYRRDAGQAHPHPSHE